MDDFAKLAASLTPEKRALLAIKLRTEGYKYNLFPLSSAQQRLWFLYQLEPTSMVYNIPLAFQVVGQLDLEALKKTIDAIIQRHEVLRTTFIEINGEPFQSIALKIATPFQVIDLLKYPEAERQTVLNRLYQEEIQKPFNLEIGPLFRVLLISSTINKYILIFTLHHIISDAWSMGILVKEFTVLYNAFSTGKPAPLAKLPIQYADYAKWQRQWLEGDVVQNQLDFWEKTLRNIPPALELPIDRPRPSVKSDAGAVQKFSLAPEVSQQLNELSEVQGTTLFMTLLAAFATLLYRYTGQSDICIGTPIANRNRAETENLIGFFVNTLVLRADLSQQPTFCELLGRIREMALGAFTNQDLPFEKLVEFLQPERNLGQTPLFQVMFVFQNDLAKQIKFTNLEFTPIELQSNISIFDLTLAMSATEDRIVGAFEYNIDIFHAATIVRMIEHFKFLLETIALNSRAKIDDLPMLPASLRQQVLLEWNDTTVPGEKLADTLVHNLFEMQVNQTPEAIALVVENQALTYRELNNRANQLAHRLQRLGAKPEMVLGICVERSIDMVVGVLGILKSGAAYLPIDPAYPVERVNFMLQECQVPILVTQTHLLSRFSDHNRQVICLDSTRENLAFEKKSNPAVELNPGNLAYIIFTSGSTGIPVGVQVSHHALLNYITFAIKHFQIVPGDRILQFASISFDAAAEEIYSCLLAGATLILRSEEMLNSVFKFIERCDRLQLTVLDLPTAFWHQWVLEGIVKGLAVPKSLRLVIIGGERALPERLVEWYSCVDHRIRLVNTYGPTETTIVATTWESGDDGDDEKFYHNVPIGTPIQNMQAFVLDKYLNPVPIGVPGELHLGGMGLARGYLNRPERTAAMFIPNPYSSIPGDRFYKTGDLVRHLPDGNIEFLDRIDYQVKIRGFRVELGEIESALTVHPAVQQAVAVARQDTYGDKRIVAYIVKNHQPPPDPGQLKTFLQDQLPYYMVPAVIMVLDELPLLPSGKVNRRALPAPDMSRPGPEEAYVAPRTPTEEVLAGIWSQLLHLDKVGRNDNFFILGGHSLLAIRLVTRIRESFQVELTLRTIFESPTLAGLARNVDLAVLSNNGLEAPPIHPVPRQVVGELPLSFAQQRLWFIDRLQPGIPFYNIPEVNRITGPLHIFALEQSINEIVRRHEVLRTGFADVDGTARQIILSSLTINLPVIDLRQVPAQKREAEARQLATTLVTTPFKLAQAPLLRILLLWLAENDYLVVLTIHHIISDGWSSGVLMQEIGTLYDACRKGQPVPLPELLIQYADFAYWQRNWLQGEILEKQLQYWKNKLQNAPPLLELPTDRPRPAVQNFKGAMCYFDLPGQLAAELRELSRQQGATMFMTMLAAFVTLLSRYSGQNDLCVGTPIAGRTRAEIENLIGFFVNTLVLRTDLTGNPNFREFLARVRDTSLEAYTHQDLPFEMLVSELQPERNLGHTPLFQVMFVLQNVSSRQLKFANLELTPVEIDRGATQFDLTLWINEAADGMTGLLEYNPDLFNKSTIDRMLAHFITLLEAIVANPEQRISALPMLTKDETKQILQDWNATATDRLDNICLQQLFEFQAEKKSDAIALRFNDRQLSYRALNQRANQLAHYLQKIGVGPDILVGIYTERSLEMVIGLMAILKAGAAYLPLEPSYPEQRLQFILTDTRIPVLLTQQHLAAHFPPFPGKIICLDTDWAVIARESTDNPTCNVTLDNLAYCIYTSGSTGQPKGTLVTHNGLTHYLNWCRMAYPLAQGRGTPVHATIAFDATITALFAPLSTGATVTLIPETKDLEVLATTLAIDREFSLVKITPAHLEILGQQLATENVTGLTKAFIIGGENLTSKHIAFWQKNAPATILINEYGPTETVVGCCVYWLDSGIPDTASIPIGRPITNTRLYLLDGNMNPAGIGIPGELYIAGAGVARGYLNRPDLTAEKFIPDPFSHEPGTRLYRSGDLARFRPDGNIEFLGRIDNQVKIRGFRIEMGEIEAILKEHPGLQDVVVLAREDTPGDKRLVAYVVAQQQPAPTVTELRHFLKSKLPEYMIPAVYVPMAAFPLTPNGKIDRKKLPAPEQLRPDLAGAFVPPRTAIESQLVQIWSKVLGIEKIGIHDNFFELGGDSILSIQVIARANQAGLQLTPGQFFQAPTIAELATLAGTGAGIKAEQGIITGTVPLTPIQHWFFAQNLPMPDHWNQSILLEVKQPLDPVILTKVIRQLLLHHDALRLCFFRTEHGWGQVITAMEEPIPFSIIDINNIKDNELNSIIETAATMLQESLDLTEGPIVRITYFDNGTKRSGRLLIIIHHLAMDGFSWRILLEDLQTTYQQLVQESGIVLPAKTTSYQHWAEKLAEYAQSTIVKRDFDYWSKLSREKITHLPVDFPDGPNTEATTRTILVSLTETETQNLLQKVPAAYQTRIDEVLLTAVTLACSQWTGKRILLIDLEGHGRENINADVDVSRTIGWFTCIYPVLLDLREAFTPAAAIIAVKEQLRQVPNQGLSFGLLRYLNKDPDIVKKMSDIPIPEVVFNYLGQFDQIMTDTREFSLAREFKGLERHPSGHRSHLLSIDGGITAGKLQMTWTFSLHQYRQLTIERLAQEFIEQLGSLISHCLAPAAGDLSPSDFPLANLDEEKLTRVLENIEF